MIQRIEKWIDETNEAHRFQRKSSDQFEAEFEGYYPPSFLNQSYFVAVKTIPKPDFPELRKMGFGTFLDMPAQGITYKNTYYVVDNQSENLRLHFHELVHVVQWHFLGASQFIQRYMAEIQNYGYNSAPLERMAYQLDQHFAFKGLAFDVLNYVKAKLEDESFKGF